jgi:hypothetical protein
MRVPPCENKCPVDGEAASLSTPPACRKNSNPKTATTPKDKNRAYTLCLMADNYPSLAKRGVGRFYEA